MADTAASSDAVFGLVWLLGYQFSPRLADIGEARFWRIDRAADYVQARDTPVSCLSPRELEVLREMA